MDVAWQVDERSEDFRRRSETGYWAFGEVDAALKVGHEKALSDLGIPCRRLARFSHLSNANDCHPKADRFEFPVQAEREPFQPCLRRLVEGEVAEWDIDRLAAHVDDVAAGPQKRNRGARAQDGACQIGVY